jgi:regulatory protein
MQNRRKQKLPSEDRLSRSAIHYLQRYSSSSANLRKVLERKVMKACAFHDRDPSEFSELIDTVVEKCLRNNLVNDQTYAETKTSGMRRRGASMRKIAAHLSAKGVDRDTIQNVLQDEDQHEKQTAVVYARRRRLGPFRNAVDRSDRRDRDMAAMCRAGFSFEIARQVIDSAKDELVEFSEDN